MSEPQVHDATELGPLVGTGRTAEVYAWGNGQIVKLYRAEIPRDWLSYEEKVARIVSEAGLQAPVVGEIVEIGGRPGIVYERITGPSMLELLPRKPWRVWQAARTFAALHAAMHDCQRPGLPSQREALVRGIRAPAQLGDETRARLLGALELLPDCEAVCHGDLHPDNVILSPRGPVVIDWMSAKHGNPVADVARTVLMFRIAHPLPGMGAGKRAAIRCLRRTFLSTYLRTYVKLRPFPLAQIDPWIPIQAAARLNERITEEESALIRQAEGVG